ncbi:divalent metal cation transporter [Acidithiobacillus thiooxidans]|uniref:divalent metal cation transporter n=1 Tax=Acidithiobacillus thiooxidans TaxID=930 RepID=UPI001F5270F9|nr:divalent metal cation transporter [Acidithiobacillus thiooxidans]
MGTTIAPWMLFFEQASVVDKGLTIHDIPGGQADTAIGSLSMGVIADAPIQRPIRVHPVHAANHQK